MGAKAGSSSSLYFLVRDAAIVLIGRKGREGRGEGENLVWKEEEKVRFRGFK